MSSNKKFFVYQYFSIFESMLFYICIDLSIVKELGRDDVIESIYKNRDNFKKLITKFKEGEDSVEIIEKENFINDVDENSLIDLSKNKNFEGKIKYMEKSDILLLLPLFDYELAKRHGFEGDEEEYNKMVKFAIESKGFPFAFNIN